jgi:hypothetical protein
MCSVLQLMPSSLVQVPRSLLPAASDESSKHGRDNEGSALATNKQGTHVHLADERNKDVLVGIRDGMMKATFDLVRDASSGNSGGDQA